MGLLTKMRILVGALVHKPFAPRPKKASPGKPPGRPENRTMRRMQAGRQVEETLPDDSERVADLINERQKGSVETDTSPGSG
jgi:hypothetical protein